jgi:hypothetical protein
MMNEDVLILLFDWNVLGLTNLDIGFVYLRLLDSIRLKSPDLHPIEHLWYALGRKVDTEYEIRASCTEPLSSWMINC